MMRGSRCQGRSATPQGAALASMRCLTCEPEGQRLQQGAKDPCRQTTAVRRRWVPRQHARLLPSEHLSATFGDSCCLGTGSAASWGQHELHARFYQEHPWVACMDACLPGDCRQQTGAQLQDCKNSILRHASLSAAVSFFAADTGRLQLMHSRYMRVHSSTQLVLCCRGRGTVMSLRQQCGGGSTRSRTGFCRSWGRHQLGPRAGGHALAHVGIPPGGAASRYAAQQNFWGQSHTCTAALPGGSVSAAWELDTSKSN